jgi:transcriptional regulator with XRE-family HTH domain
MNVREQFASNLLYLRKRSGLSQEEVSFRASLHRTEVGMLERGVRLPRIDTLVKLAGALEVTPAELLDGISWRPAEIPSGRFETSESPPT